MNHLKGKIVRTKQTQRRRVFNPLIPRESIFLSEPPPEVIENYRKMVRKTQKERELKEKKAREKQERKRLNDYHKKQYEDHQRSIRLPAQNDLPQTWYHKRMSLVKRLITLKGLYAEFDKICEIQKAHAENPERPWADFPSSLISDLQEYEEIPSDELIALSVSGKYRMRDTAKTIEGERSRLELSNEILCQSNWREYGFVDFVSDTGDTYSRVRSYPASGSHFKSVFPDAKPQTKTRH